MVITIVDESIHITKLSVHGAGFEHPIEFFVRGNVSDSIIHELEQYITHKRNVDQWTGVYECLIQFARDNNLPNCNLS